VDTYPQVSSSREWLSFRVVETVTTERLPTMAGIRKADAPIPQEPFPMSEQQFLTHGTAANAALEECMKKIDAGFAA